MIRPREIPRKSLVRNLIIFPSRTNHSCSEFALNSKYKKEMVIAADNPPLVAEDQSNATLAGVAQVALPVLLKRVVQGEMAQ
jgi:hypothetical protein